MYAKIVALTVVAALFANGAIHRALSPDLYAGAMPRMQLVPDAVGDWKKTAQWLYSAGMGQYQEYGQYAAGGRVATLSFDHNRTIPHDALHCFTVRAEALESQAVVMLRSVDGNARFDLGRFSDGKSRSIVVSSQCFAGGCVENPPAPRWSDALQLSFWRNLLLPSRYTAIPVNVSITPDASSGPASDAELDQAMADFVAHLDLRPARDRSAAVAADVPR